MERVGARKSPEAEPCAARGDGCRAPSNAHPPGAPRRMLALRGLVGGLISIPLRQRPPAPGIALRWSCEPAVKRPPCNFLPPCCAQTADRRGNGDASSRRSFIAKRFCDLTSGALANAAAPHFTARMRSAQPSAALLQVRTMIRRSDRRDSLLPDAHGLQAMPATAARSQLDRDVVESAIRFGRRGTQAHRDVSEGYSG